MSSTVRIDKVEIQWSSDVPRGTFCQAVAEVSYQISDQGDRRIEWLRSGGLHVDTPIYGAYRIEIEIEQVEDLRDHLAQFGIVLTNDQWATLSPARRLVQRI